jgi:hypothetical protein
MRLYSSPVQLKPSNIQKKSSINFVKNIAAPKQVKSQYIYNNQNAPNNQTYNHNSNGHNYYNHNMLKQTLSPRI